MATELNMKIDNPISIMNRDVEIAVVIDGTKLGTLKVSKGSIDWRPRYGRRGSGYKLRWSQFADLMQDKGTQRPRTANPSTKRRRRTNS